MSATFGRASLQLTTNAAQLNQGLGKAGADIKKAAKGWNETLKQAFSGAFAGGVVGQVIGKIGGKALEGVTKALEDGLERIGEKLKKVFGGRRGPSEEERLQQQIQDAERVNQALDRQKQAFDFIRESVAGVAKETEQLGRSPWWKKWDDFRREVKKLNLPAVTKENAVNQMFEALKKNKDATEKMAEKQKEWRDAVKGTGEALKAQIDRAAEALHLNEEFATANEKLAAAMERLEKLRKTGLLKDGVFEKAKRKLEDDILGPGEFRFASGNLFDSREAAEDVIRARFGAQRPGAEPLKDVPKKLDKQNEIGGQIRDAVKGLAGRVGLAPVFEVFDG